MDEFMLERLTKRGKYEDSAGLRYFGNEKFRKKNYFGKQKLVANEKRMTSKRRMAEIQRRMDMGIKYDLAGTEPFLVSVMLLVIFAHTSMTSPVPSHPICR